MENSIKKFEQYIKEDLATETESENVLDFISSLGFDVTTDKIDKETIQDILIDISDKVDDQKYHWVETELTKLIQQ